MKSAVHFTFSRGETMIKKTLVNVGVVALLGGVAVAAQAATVKINLGFANGSVGMTVGKTNEGSPNDFISASAGAFKGQFGGNNGQGLATSPFNGSNFITYCVQLTQNFFLDTTYQHSYIGGQSYFNNFSPALAVTGTGATVVNRLEKLFSSLGSNQLADIDGIGDQGSIRSAAIQLAVWEAIYEGDTGYGQVDGATDGNGRFGASGNASSLPAVITLAESILDDAIRYTGQKKFSIGVLQNSTRQDFIVVDGGGFQSGLVPEPTSLALTLGALGALGFAARRRQTTKI